MEYEQSMKKDVLAMLGAIWRIEIPMSLASITINHLGYHPFILTRPGYRQAAT